MYVSAAMIKRLPAYYRHLKELERENVRQISSKELGQRRDRPKFCVNLQSKV